MCVCAINMAINSFLADCSLLLLSDVFNCCYVITISILSLSLSLYIFVGMLFFALVLIFQLYIIKVMTSLIVLSETLLRKHMCAHII